jgi:ABC-type amino acid transport substrate-binding protein
MRLKLALAGLVAAILSSASQAWTAVPLTFCLDDNAPPLSFNEGGKVGGFDVKVAQAIATKLGRELAIQWFATEEQPELGEDSKTSIAALLADGRCDLAGSYPLLADSLGDSLAAQGRLPRFDGGKREDRVRPIALSPLMPTIPFISTAPTVILGPSAKITTVKSLSDLDGVRVGVEQASLSNVMLQLYQDGRLLPRLHHIVPGGGLLERLEAREYDAVAVDLHRFDGYRTAHPATSLKQTGFLLPFDINLGFVGLARNAGLILTVNSIIGEMLADGTIKGVAGNAGLTYLPPRDPAIRPSLSLTDLAKGEMFGEHRKPSMH